MIVLVCGIGWSLLHAAGRVGGLPLKAIHWPETPHRPVTAIAGAGPQALK